MLSDYCWSLKRDTNVSHKRKAIKRSFETKRKRFKAINIYAEQKEFVYNSVKKNLKNKTGAMNPGKPRNDRL